MVFDEWQEDLLTIRLFSNLNLALKPDLLVIDIKISLFRLELNTFH